MNPEIAVKTKWISCYTLLGSSYGVILKEYDTFYQIRLLFDSMGSYPPNTTKRLLKRNCKILPKEEAIKMELRRLNTNH